MRVTRPHISGLRRVEQLTCISLPVKLAVPTRAVHRDVSIRPRAFPRPASHRRCHDHPPQTQKHAAKLAGRSIKTCWIAHARETLGLPVKIAYNRKGPSRQNPCPPFSRTSGPHIASSGRCADVTNPEARSPVRGTNRRAASCRVPNRRASSGPRQVRSRAASVINRGLRDSESAGLSGSPSRKSTHAKRRCKNERNV